jgi:sporulation protein YlmC with PRC-barrel domain
MQTIRQLIGDRIMALDGSIGTVDDVYFDSAKWAVRYLVVHTGALLLGKRMLISPASIVACEAEQVRLDITREQVERAPHEDTDRPVSRQEEMRLALHYGHSYYWSGPMLWGLAPYPAHGLAVRGGPVSGTAGEAQAEPAEGDPELRSGNEVIGYAIEASDGSIGEVQDFVVDEKSWAIAAMSVDTRKWWPGGHARVEPRHVTRVDWAARKVHVELTREAIRHRRAA